MSDARLRLVRAIEEIEESVHQTPTGDPVRVVDRLVANAVVRVVLSTPPDRDGRIVVDADQVARQLETMRRSNFEPSVVKVPYRSWSVHYRDIPPDTGEAA